MRRCPAQDTVRALERITARRNKIAHEGDRRGYGRAHITIEEVVRDLDTLESIVQAIDKAIGDQFAKPSANGTTDASTGAIVPSARVQVALATGS